MAIMSTNCCLNILPPLPDSKSIPALKSLSTRTDREARPWKITKGPKLVMGLACAIIGLEMAMPDIDLITTTHQTSLASEVQYVVSSTKGNAKWSDKRSCESWNLNSLETIVPENLPRPSAHRRWEAVAYDSLGHPIAKTFILIKKAMPGCFSM